MLSLPPPSQVRYMQVLHLLLTLPGFRGGVEALICLVLYTSMALVLLVMFEQVFKCQALLEGLLHTERVVFFY